MFLQIVWCFTFWATNLYNGDAEISRFGETENLIRLTFIIMTTCIFLLGIDINLGPVKSQYIIRYWILFSLLTILNRWVIRSIQKFLLKKGFGQHNVIVIGSGERSSFVTEKLLNHQQKLYRVLGHITTDSEKDESENEISGFLGKEKNMKDIIAQNPISDIVIALDVMDHDHILKLISIINGSPVSIKIVPDLYEVISGLARTVRGPSMSATPGKVQVDGVAEINGTKVIVLRMLQGRNPKWVNRPFFAKYDENAIWLDDLKPAFEDKFFFEDELKQIKEQKTKSMNS